MAIVPLLLAALLAQVPAPLVQQSRRAKDLMAAGKFQEAIPIYEELCRALPGNPGLLLNLGLAYQAVGNHDLAIPHFEAALEGEPRNTVALVSLSASRMAVGDAPKAAEALEKAAKLPGATMETRGMLGNAYLASERFTEAAAVFRQLTTATPKDPKAWSGLGRAYDALSAAGYEKLSNSASGSAEWLAIAAWSRIEQRQYRSAFYFFQQALAKNPSLRGAWRTIAEIYRKTNHADWAAAAEKKEAALAAPDCAKSKAECDFLAGRYESAAATGDAYWQTRAYNELSKQAYAQIEKMPPSVELHAIRAQIHSQHGRHIDAANEWRAADKLRPNDPRIRRDLAMSIYMSRDYKTALPLLDAFRQQDKDSPELSFFVGDCLMRLEQPEKALPLLQQTADASPDFLPAHASLGLALARLGKQQEAIPHLKAALDMDEDASLHYQLSRAYQATGQPDLAKQTLAAYQELRKKLDADKKTLDEEVQITPP